MSIPSFKVVLIRLDGLTASFDTCDMKQARYEAQAMMTGLWGKQSPVAKLFVSHDGQLDELDVDLIRSMKVAL